jgi:predicted TIM-barrel fold metal-dependent hydrolase
LESDCSIFACPKIFAKIFESIEEHRRVRQIHHDVFGSDFPLHDLAFQLGRLWFARLPDEHKRMILGLNMLRILGMK